MGNIINVVRTIIPDLEMQLQTLYIGSCLLGPLSRGGHASGVKVILW